jgi:hypothetical protein
VPPGIVTPHVDAAATVVTGTELVIEVDVAAVVVILDAACLVPLLPLLQAAATAARNTMQESHAGRMT